MNTVSQSSVDVARLIDERPISGLQCWVVVICALTVMFDGYGLQVMALVVPALSQEWGVPAAEFGLPLSAALIGMSVGAAFLAPFGDRVGRRTVVMAGMLLIAGSSLCTTLARSPDEFILWRLLTGIGLGICVPNCNAWVAEYAPVRRRSFVIVLVNSAIGVGAFGAGFIAPPLVDAWGWRAPFVFGGLLSLAITLLIFLSAPESLKFMVVSRPQDKRIAEILRRIAPGVDAGLIHVAKQTAELRRSVFELLAPAYRTRTLVLWLIFALNLFTLYLLVSWLPTLLQMSGWALGDAQRGAVLIQAGGIVGGIGLSFLLDRGQTLPALRASFVLAAACLLGFLVLPSGLSWVVLLLLIGCGINGTQLSLNALGTAYYPPSIKATGMAWTGVMGNWGGMLGPIAGAALVGYGVAPTNILALAAIPVLLAAAGVWLMRQEWQAH